MAVTVSASVIVVGAIPFIGLVVPNLVAMRHGENLGRTLPIVALGGASLLLACDIVGRLLMYRSSADRPDGRRRGRRAVPDTDPAGLR